jgi:hypothetical protein
LSITLSSYNSFHTCNLKSSTSTGLCFIIFHVYYAVSLGFCCIIFLLSMRLKAFILFHFIEVSINNCYYFHFIQVVILMVLSLGASFCIVVLRFKWVYLIYQPLQMHAQAMLYWFSLSFFTGCSKIRFGRLYA